MRHVIELMVWVAASIAALAAAAVAGARLIPPYLISE
jgi:hypothetical protein